MADHSHYGNALTDLETDEAPKKFKDDTVRDEKGRRRFHGAFTGGFSAGYFNSVDTKEGWTPSQFVSSRSSRASKPSQRPEDYMDTEDIGELGFAPQRLQVQDAARASTSIESNEKRRQGYGSQRELLNVPLQRLLDGSRESVGEIILRSMGWRHGKGIGPKVCLKNSFGPQLPQEFAEAEVAPDDIEFNEIKGTDKVWGLGYTPATRSDLFAEKLDRERITQTVAKVGGRRLGIRGQAFGVGAFEEDDEDIYAKDDMTQYAFEEIDHRAPPLILKALAIESKKGKSNLLDGFVAVEVSDQVFSKLTRIEVPANWKPRIADSHLKDLVTMNREQKIATISDAAPEGSIFNFLSEEARARIEATKRAIQERANQRSEAPSTSQADSRTEQRQSDDEQDTKGPLPGVVDVESLQPFSQKPEKQARFERYIQFAERGHREMLSSIQPVHFTSWEATLEKKDFEAALLLVRPHLGLKNRFETRQVQSQEDTTLPTGLANAKDLPAAQTSDADCAMQGPPVRPLDEFGSNTHAEFEWHPKSLLCKRFNVPDPFPGNEFAGVVIMNASSFESIKTEYVINDLSPSETSPRIEHTESTNRASADLPMAARTEVLPTFVEETEAEKSPPPFDLFKLIFSDDDQDDDGNEREASEGTSTQSRQPETSRTMNESSTKKNTGIFANIDLSALNTRLPAVPLQKIEQTEVEQDLPEMGPKLPPVFALERSEIHSKSKSKRKKMDKKRKKSSKHKKKSKKKQSESSSDTESGNEKPRSSRRKKRSKNKKSKKRKRNSSSNESSSASSELFDIDQKLLKKLRHFKE